MYKTIIEFSENLNQDELKELKDIANSNFFNRAGKVENTSTDSNILIFDGKEDDYGCIHLGIISLYKNEFFRKKIKKWNYIDEDNSRESCDVLHELSSPVR